RSAVAGRSSGRRRLQASFGDRVFDAVGELRAGSRPRTGFTVGTHLGEIGAALRCVVIPLHRSVSGAQALDVDGGMAEPAVHRLQARRQVAGLVGLSSGLYRGGAIRVTGEIRCLGPESATAASR